MNLKNKLKGKNNNINNILGAKIIGNLAYPAMIMIYFIFFNIQYKSVSEEMLIQYINISSMVFIAISIIIIEIAYKKEEDSLSIYGIEFLALATFTLLIKHIPKILNYNIQNYILIGSYAFGIYYILKLTILYTMEKKKELNNLSDIKEIVKEEPIKKATKRKNKKEEGK